MANSIGAVSPSRRSPTLTRRGPLSVVAAVGLILVLAAPALATFPFPESSQPEGVYDYAEYLFVENGDCSGGPNDLPANFDCVNDWKFTDHRVPNTSPDNTYDPAVADNPQEFYGVKGVGLNRAWEVTTGRPDVVIAVLDSGIRWEEDLPPLVNKYFLNRFELPTPQGGPNPDDGRFDGYDVNEDGAFNARDYTGDGRVSDLNGNGVIDPEDLIRIFSDGTDADANGYVDDISGWDFFENDNNPQDDTDYGHGTGEAEDSTGEVAPVRGQSAGDNPDGQCPNCMMMPMRVGDSFVADVNHWAEAVIYAVDNGASVVQEALGTLNHTSFGQAAADYAYANGVIINASEADEAAGHHNWPAAYDHTMVVNSILRFDVEGQRAAEPNSYLYFNGCTNFGGYTYVSIPSTSCSSEATGRSSGVSGLLYSAALNAIESGEMTPYIQDDGSQAAYPLSAEEAMQLWRLAADDIDFSSGCTPPVVHDFCDHNPSDVPVPTAPLNNYGTSIPASTRYQSVHGWDYFFGYGRNNAARLTRYLGRAGVEYDSQSPGPYAVTAADPLDAQDRIPPEADITFPRWWGQYPYEPDSNTLLVPDDPNDPGVVVVQGRVAANRVTADGGTFDWVLEWAPHVQGQKAPAGFRSAPGSEEESDGPWTVAASGAGLDQAYQGELGRIPVEELAAALAGNPNPFDPATDPTSELQPERFAIRLRIRVIAHPTDPADTVNNEAVRQKQIDVYPSTESVIRSDIGIGGEPSGGAGAPSFHDLDGDGEDELLLPTEDGVIHAYTNVATGQELSGWPVTTDTYPGIRTTGDNAYTNGAVPSEVPGSVLLGTLAVADLDDDGELEVSIGDLEGRLYVWEHDGSRRAGFPVSVDPSLSKEPPCAPATIPACDDYAPGPSNPGGIRGELNDRDWGINSAPAVGDLDPSYRGLELVVGSNDGHVYAWHQDGSPVEGWPVILRDPEKVAAMDRATHHVTYVDGAEALRGTKVLVSPSLGDIDVDGDLEVVLGVNEEYEETPNADFSTDPLSEAGATGPGNTRVYALHHDGAAHPGTPGTQSTPHTQDQAYLEGWPVPIAMLVTDLLPYVGEGTNSQSVLADIKGGLGDTDEQLEIVIASAVGPGYILNHDGSSFLGVGPSGKYRTLATTGFGAGSTSSDEPSYVAVGGMAIGSLDGGIHLTIAGPGAGLKRALDVLIPADQAGAEDHLSLWNASTGDYEENAPINVNDLQFFTSPVVADVTGDGLAEVIQSTAVSDLVAAGLTNNAVTATRFHTGGWGVTAAAVGQVPMGDADDGSVAIAMVTREGFLRVWSTPVEENSAASCESLSQWPEYGHDAFNSGNYLVDGERPYPLRTLETEKGARRQVTLKFTATGDDRYCGKADRYSVRIMPGHVEDPEWETGTRLKMKGGAPAPSGQPDQVTGVLPPRRGNYTLMIRAYDEAENGSALRSVFVTVTRHP